MADNNKYEDVSSFSGKIISQSDKTISFPALDLNKKSRVRLFVYFLVLVLFSLIFLVVGYKLSYYNYSFVNTQEKISNTNITASDSSSQNTDLSDILKCTVSISVFNDNYLSEATGVIISSDGYIVTNDHIYQNVNSPEIMVFDSDNRQYNAEFIAGDSKYDVSVIKIDADNLPYATFNSNAVIEKGCEIISVGRGGSVTKGIVSEYVYETSGQSKSVKMIRTDCAVNPGDSGGPVISGGKLVALNCSKTVSLDVEGMSYLLPANTVVRAIEQLISNKCVTDRAALGISYKYISPVYACLNNCVSGIRIELINSDSDLYGRGFTENDVIIAIDGKDIVSEDTMLDCLSSHIAGDTIELTVRKINGTDMNVTVTLCADSSFSCYSDE